MVNRGGLDEENGGLIKVLSQTHGVTVFLVLCVPADGLNLLIVRSLLANPLGSLGCY